MAKTGNGLKWSARPINTIIQRGQFPILQTMSHQPQRHLGLLGVTIIILILTSFLLYGRPLGQTSLQSRVTKRPVGRERPRASFRVSDEEFVVIVKTGANEIHHKVPVQILTSLSCYRYVLIFSDLDGNLGRYEAHDILKNVSGTLHAHALEFNYYRQLQHDKENDQDVGERVESSKAEAWRLGKYKFLSMPRETWRMRPRRKWYVFIEADTYLVRTSLLLWLERLDPSEIIYLGSPTYVHNDAFAHGGSGIILSGAALERFAEGRDEVGDNHDDLLQSEAFGDYILMRALRDSGITLSSGWPMLQGENPSTIHFAGTFGESGGRLWCQPVVTMHHVTPEESYDLWNLEQRRRSPTVCSSEAIKCATC